MSDAKGPSQPTSPPTPPYPPPPAGSGDWEQFNARFGAYVKLGFLFVLVVLLIVPLELINGLVGERKQRRDSAVAEIAGTWGHPQRVTGPALVIPYRYTIPPQPFVDRKGEQRMTEPDTRTGFIHVLPDTTAIDGSLSPTVRYRGIFEAVLYSTSLKVGGTFRLPDLAALGIKAEEVLWDQAVFAVGISDLRGASGEPKLRWDGREADFLPRTKSAVLGAGVHAPVRLEAPAVGAAPRIIPFAFAIDFKGSKRIAFTPVGKATTVSLASPWPHPSFDGAYLPKTRTIGKDGFKAAWEVSYLGRDYPQAWKSHGEKGEPLDMRGLSRQIPASQFGVSLVTPVDFYVKTERSVKYGMLFVLLVLAAIFGFEVTKERRVHLVQYAFVGVALCVFFLLLLSIAELIGFLGAYLIAAALATALVALYVAKAMASWRQAAVVAVLQAAIYGFLYIVLQLEDYALIVGAMGVFVALAAVMYGTRNVDWYRPRPRRAPVEQRA